MGVGVGVGVAVGADAEVSVGAVADEAGGACVAGGAVQLATNITATIKQSASRDLEPLTMAHLLHE